MPNRLESPTHVDRSCRPKDQSPPPAPQVRVSIAFERPKQGSTFRADPPPPRPAPPNPSRDPAYFEFGNVEVGTTIQILNMSKQPNADWANTDHVVALKLTGQDVQNRMASAYLTVDQMKAIDLQPGDMLQVRAVDEAGNASPVATLELEPDDWARGTVREPNGDTFEASRGMMLNALDGESARKEIIARTVLDTRPPALVKENVKIVTDDRFSAEDKQFIAPLSSSWNVIKRLQGRDAVTQADCATLAQDASLPQPARDALAKLAADEKLFTRIDCAYHNDPAKADGIIASHDVAAVMNHQRSVTLLADAALEPRVTLRVQNQRTGREVSGNVGDDRQVRINLGDAEDGDPLFLTATDNEGQTGPRIELIYSSKCKDGKSEPPSRPVLPGVIE